MWNSAFSFTVVLSKSETSTGVGSKGSSSPVVVATILTISIFCWLPTKSKPLIFAKSKFPETSPHRILSNATLS